MSVKELKLLSRNYGLNITGCFEKADIIAKINSRELRKKLATESLARFGLRIAIVDCHRNCVTIEELCCFK
jgi:hypothetical protein